MTLAKLSRAIELLSKGDPFAWGILGFSIVLTGVLLVIRRQSWFIAGGDTARRIVIIVATVVSVATVLVAVLLQHSLKDPAANNSVITW
jgi:hypothetical protein